MTSADFREVMKGAVTIGTQEWFDVSKGQIFVRLLDGSWSPVCFFCGEKECEAECDAGLEWRKNPRPI